MASLVLGSLGSSLLGPIGGFLGSSIGGFIDNALFGSPTEGPKLDDLRAVRGDPGLPIPLVFGADRLPGIVMGSTELIETVHKTKATPFGGKGGGNITITYTYHVDIDYLLGEGPILGVGRIWADGNLVRGTRYEMKTNTSLYPENIGGIPYPDYYRSHYYEPATLPWSIDRGDAPHNATDDGHYYRSNGSREAMVRINQTQAEELLENTKHIVYWKDTATGYYIPVTQSHGYTGEKPVEAEGGEGTKGARGISDTLFAGIANTDNSIAKTRDLTGSLKTSIGNGNTESTLIALGDNVQSGNLSFTLTGTSFSNVDATLADFYIDVDYYGEGDNILVDSTPVGEQIGIRQSAREAVPHGKSPQIVQFTLNTTVPAGAKFAVAKLMGLAVLSIFATTETRADYAGSLNIVEDNPNIRDWPDYWNLYDAINDFSPKAVLAFDGPDQIKVYRGRTDIQPADAEMAAALEEDVPGYKGRAHVVFNTLQLDRYNNRIPQFSFEIVQFDNVRVRNVIEDMMSRAELDSKYYDATALPVEGKDEFVMGYAITNRVSFRAAIETMTDAFRVDVAEIGNKLVYRKRKRAVDYVIPRKDLAAVESGDNPGDPVRFTFRDRVDMPRRLVVRYKDPERNYQPNTAEYRREQGPSVGDQVVEVASVLRNDYAKRYVRDRMQDAWTERSSTVSDVPHKYVYLAPTDIVLLDGSETNEADITVKLSTVTRGENGLIELEGFLQQQDLYPFEEGEEDDTGRNQITFGHPGSNDNTVPWTKVELLDLPPLWETTEHANYGAYLAMGGGFGDRWTGATLNRSTNMGASYNAVNVATREAVFGTILTGTLEAADAEFVDYESVLFVTLRNPASELESASSDDLFQGANAALIGTEIVQFQNAEKQADGTWRLDTFLRGRRGTDIPATLNGHAGFESFTLMRFGEIINYEDLFPKLNTEVYYKGVSFGALVADTSVTKFTNTGKRLTPLAPNHITGVRDGSDNITISWRRRDRVFQSMVDNADIQNSEEFERYELEILNDSATIVRTQQVDDATSWVYSIADQTTDGVNALDNITVNIYQISNTVGRGNKGEAVV